ncbi:MAG: GIY-YIG nuclease family protein [Thermoanaerobaculia bacterium]
MPHVYLLRCRDGSLYTGAAVDVSKRMREHASGRASRYTRSRLPVELAWSREMPSWSAALVEEARIKSLSRGAKELLIVTPPAAEPISQPAPVPACDPQ